MILRFLPVVLSEAEGETVLQLVLVTQKVSGGNVSIAEYEYHHASRDGVPPLRG